MTSKFLLLVVLLMAPALMGFSQSQLGVTDTRPVVLEIQYSEGMPLAYQRIGGATLFGAFRTLPDWKPAIDAPVIQGINLRSSIIDGGVGIRVSLLEGKNLEIEVPVGQYTVIDGSATVVKDLEKFGLAPIKVAIVRSPAMVAALPTVENKTKSLSVNVEPVASNIPSFRVRVSNISAKAVMAYASETSSNGKTRLTSISHDLNGTVLIEPGHWTEKILPYPVKPITASVGEIPEAQGDLVFTLQALVFEDGTYEGEPRFAARFRAMQVGQKIEIQHLVNQLGAKYDSIDAFAAELSNYEFSMDETVFAAYLKEFPGLTDREVADLRKGVEVSAVYTQQDIFRTFSAKRAGFTSNQGSFQAWKDAEIKQCIKLLDSFPK